MSGETRVYVKADKPPEFVSGAPDRDCIKVTRSFNGGVLVLVDDGPTGAAHPLTQEETVRLRDHTLLPATLEDYEDLAKVLGPLPEHPVLSLDAGYDYRWVHQDVAERHIIAKIAKRGEQTPIQAGGRWVVERTNAWMNNFGRLRRCTERRRACIDFYTDLASAIITVRSLIRRAWYCYRWDARPSSPRIR